ncbi:hypothetical protein KW787_01655 [Candidatus Pacearchaeota archaeon]|nr:hypothetical protein [Candidatus Pacearchaeota archaeon]
MHSKFKRHQKVRILREPDPEYIEYYSEEPIPIKKGMTGKINILLSNGKYHVEIDKDGEVIAYAPFNEEDIEPID